MCASLSFFHKLYFITVHSCYCYHKQLLGVRLFIQEFRTVLMSMDWNHDNKNNNIYLENEVYDPSFNSVPLSSIPFFFLFFFFVKFLKSKVSVRGIQIKLFKSMEMKLLATKGADLWTTCLISRIIYTNAPQCCAIIAVCTLLFKNCHFYPLKY